MLCPLEELTCTYVRPPFIIKLLSEIFKHQLISSIWHIIQFMLSMYIFAFCISASISMFMLVQTFYDAFEVIHMPTYMWICLKVSRSVFILFLYYLINLIHFFVNFYSTFHVKFFHQIEQNTKDVTCYIRTNYTLSCHVIYII